MKYLLVLLMLVFFISCWKMAGKLPDSVENLDTASTINNAQCQLLVSQDDRHPGCMPGVLTSVNYNNGQSTAYDADARLLCEAVCSAMWLNRDSPAEVWPSGLGEQSSPICPSVYDDSQTFLATQYINSPLKLAGSYGSAALPSICICGESLMHHDQWQSSFFASNYSHCYNHVSDCGETGVDCGGAGCPACNTIGQGCQDNQDCSSRLQCVTPVATTFEVDPSNSQNWIRVSTPHPEFKGCGKGSDFLLCDNGQKDGLETNVDCGGPTCNACPACSTCVACESCQPCLTSPWLSACSTCPAASSIAASCNTCTSCQTTHANPPSCVVAQDCSPPGCVAPTRTGPLLTLGNYAGCGAPLSSYTSTCSDGVKDGAESDVDCGGGCASCASNKQCISTSDCVSGAVCTNGKCS